MTRLLPVLLTTGVILENGGTDAPNSVSACVASGVLTPKRASLLAAVCNFVGAAVSGFFFPGVARTLSELSGLPSGEKGVPALTAAMLAVLLWTGLTWALSVPTSESHALMAAMGGASMAGGFERWGAMLAAAAGSAAAGWLFGRLSAGLLRRFHPSEKGLGGAQLVLAALGAALHGAQDGQKFMCILALSGEGGIGELSPETVLWCAGAMALGTALCGKRMLALAGSLGVDGRLSGLAADVGGAAVLFSATALGIPVSTTHVKTASAAGTGLRDSAQKKTFLRLILAWGLTFPACAFLGRLLVPFAEFLFYIA